MTSRQRTPWAQGRADVDRLLDARQVERVPVNDEHAQVLLTQARTHVQSARATAEADPVGAYSLAYDGARKALLAVLASEGLRSTTAGGHVAPADTVTAQFPTPFKRLSALFHQMRRTRHNNEYPSPGLIPASTEEALAAAQDATEIIEAADTVAQLLPRY